MANISIEDFCQIVLNIRFFPDNEPRETLRPPWFVLENFLGDCDDVAILCAFFAKSKGLKYYFSLWGENNSITHISTTVLMNDGRYFLFDPFGSNDLELYYRDKWRN